jgi:broad specificity phosphatase PhoE
MARYWFVRHGESTANAEGWLAGHRDAPLTERGIAQAMALRETLRGIAPQRVLTSDLQRAWRTALLAWEERRPAVQRTPHLRERHLGAWEGEVIAELHARGGMDVLKTWDESPPGGESHRTLSLRVARLLAEVDDGKDTLIFAHGGLIRAVVGCLDDVPQHEIGLFKVANTEVLVRDVPRGTWAALQRRLS